MTDMILPPGWLAKETARASAIVATWPQWMRDWCDEYLANKNGADACVCSQRCDEAQTCVGGCVYNKTGKEK
jgi:hypothetical protein